MSLNGTSCSVDIYKQGYSGGVTTLTGAAQPFMFEDDASTDLLSWIRTRTGYIRVIELSGTQLRALQPSTSTEHYVKAYYGSTLVFTGYMQCAEYSNDWIAPPSECEFAVVSPLGLLSSTYFTAGEPTMTTLGALLQEIITTLMPDCESIIYPGDLTTLSGETYGSGFPWNGKISTNAVCPFNSEFEHWDTVSDLYSPKDFQFFLEGVCACFGWMVHDEADKLVFTDVSYHGWYLSVGVSDLGSDYTSQYYNDLDSRYWQLANYFALYGDDGVINVVKPLRSLTVTPSGVGSYNGTLDIKDSLINGVTHSSTAKVLVHYFTPVGPKVSGDYILQYPTYGATGLYPVAYSPYADNVYELSFEEGWVAKWSSSWNTLDTIISAKFYGCPNRSASRGELLLKLSLKVGETLGNMLSNGYNSVSFFLYICVDGKYVVGGVGGSPDTYTTTRTPFGTVSVDRETGKVVPNKPITAMGYGYTDVDGILFSPTGNIDVVNSITVELCKNSSVTDGYYTQFNLSLVNPEGDKYFRTVSRGKSYKITNVNTKGTEDKNLSVNINNYTLSTGTQSFGNSDGLINGTPPGFGYMFSPQTFLEIPVRSNGNSLPTDFYLPQYTTWLTNADMWRAIRMKFELRDDLYHLLLLKN